MKISKKQLKIMGGENMRPEYMSGHRNTPYVMSIVDNNLLGTCLIKDIFISRYRGIYSLVSIFHNHIIQNYNIPTLLMNSIIYTIKNEKIMIILLNSSIDDSSEEDIHIVSLVKNNGQETSSKRNVVYNALKRCSHLERKSIVFLEHTAGKEPFEGERLACVNTNPLSKSKINRLVGVVSNIDNRHVVFGIKLPIIINGVTVDINTFLNSTTIKNVVDVCNYPQDSKILSYIYSGGMSYKEMSKYMPAKYCDFENVSLYYQSGLYKYLQLGINRLFNSSLTLDKIPTYRGDI